MEVAKRLPDWLAKRELSDRGACKDTVENAIYCRELLASMHDRGREAAIARHLYGRSWEDRGHAGFFDQRCEGGAELRDPEGAGRLWRELRRGRPAVFEIRKKRNTAGRQ